MKHTLIVDHAHSEGGQQHSPGTSRDDSVYYIVKLGREAGSRGVLGAGKHRCKGNVGGHSRSERKRSRSFSIIGARLYEK